MYNDFEYQAPVSGSGNLEGGVEEELISLASEGSSGDSSSPVQVLARKLILIHQDVLSLADFVRSSDFADDTVGSVLSESGVVANPIFFHFLRKTMDLFSLKTDFTEILR